MEADSPSFGDPHFFFFFLFFANGFWTGMEEGNGEKKKSGEIEGGQALFVVNLERGSWLGDFRRGCCSIAGLRDGVTGRCWRMPEKPVAGWKRAGVRRGCCGYLEVRGSAAAFFEN